MRRRDRHGSRGHRLDDLISVLHLKLFPKVESDAHRKRFPSAPSPRHGLRHAMPVPRPSQRRSFIDTSLKMMLQVAMQKNAIASADLRRRKMHARTACAVRLQNNTFLPSRQSHIVTSKKRAIIIERRLKEAGVFITTGASPIRPPSGQHACTAISNSAATGPPMSKAIRWNTEATPAPPSVIVGSTLCARQRNAATHARGALSVVPASG